MTEARTQLGQHLLLTYPGSFCHLERFEFGDAFHEEWDLSFRGYLGHFVIRHLLTDFRDLEEHLFDYVERYGASFIGELLRGLLETVERIARRQGRPDEPELPIMHDQKEAELVAIISGTTKLLLTHFPDIACQIAGVPIQTVDPVPTAT